MAEPISKQFHHGDIIVADGTIQGVILYIGDHAHIEADGNKTPAEDKDPFAILYLDGTVIGCNERFSFDGSSEYIKRRTEIFSVISDA